MNDRAVLRLVERFARVKHLRVLAFDLDQGLAALDQPENGAGGTMVTSLLPRAERDLADVDCSHFLDGNWLCEEYLTDDFIFAILSPLI